MNSKTIKIHSSEISVVIQGPLNKSLAPTRGVHACIKSIRSHLPMAEIIVSTWDTEDTSNIEADVIITSPDPGALLDFNGNKHNINRQLVSTLKGIQSSSRDYILKLRSDIILNNSEIAKLDFYEDQVEMADRLFKNPITVTTLFIRNAAKVPFLFHISDLVQFGTREDIHDFWSQSLLRQEEVFLEKPYKNPVGNFIGYSAMRMVPEQCLMLGFMRKKGYTINLKNPGHIDARLVHLSEKLISENFTILDWNLSGLNFPERFLVVGYSLKTVYKSSELKKIRTQRQIDIRIRYLRVWLNKYLFNCTRLAWWVSLASIALTVISPRLAIFVRGYFRRLRGVEHPSRDRV
ncbi:MULTISPECIES: WavE lipopolysaccharide synthesis family protein [Pseudomonadaceae]|uniref:WavE lipopolysaccharide synthesis family protein n=1 Tax=Pseudomonadaceae TaxID=135621 RepID=UPI0005CA3F73|nr:MULTISPECIES: WavE lipopolysaccharide synthesis family protein [Pseudomonas]MBO2927895.1 WavE lipopolysaccharide synthesis [Pseudomonas otitidis]